MKLHNITVNEVIYITGKPGPEEADAGDDSSVFLFCFYRNCNIDFHKEHDCTIYEGKTVYGSTLETPRGINTMNKCAKICTELKECDGFSFSGILCLLKGNSRLTNSNGWRAGICPKGEVQLITFDPHLKSVLLP